MKIIEGKLRGITIRYKEQKGTRVSSEKVRKAVFDVLKGKIGNPLISLETNLAGLKVADLFCGSGMYGIEAISRLADGAWFVDKDRRVVGSLKKNLKEIERKFRKEIKYKILNISYDRFIKSCNERFDLIFADPPYYQFDFDKLNEVSKILNTGGVFVLEQSKRGGAKELKGLELFLKKKYGDTVVCFYKNGNI